ncbi:MAG TPA: MFS transporter, partial [Geobacteraceae bacterium]
MQEVGGVVTNRYRIFAIGDVNAFFGLMLDNMSCLVIMATILTTAFQMPREIVLQRMVPGSAVGVLFGDLLYTWMAVRLARRTGSTTVTAMPLGLDT